METQTITKRDGLHPMCPRCDGMYPTCPECGSLRICFSQTDKIRTTIYCKDCGSMSLVHGIGYSLSVDSKPHQCMNCMAITYGPCSCNQHVNEE